MLSVRCLEELFAGAQEGVLLLDAEGTVACGNPFIGELLGIPTADLLSRNFHLLQQIRQNPAPAQIPCTIVADDSRHERSLLLVFQPVGIETLAGHLLLRLTSKFVPPVTSAQGESHKDIRSLELDWQRAGGQDWSFPEGGWR
jgi:hypothetical protein